MTCYSPLTGYYSNSLTEKGKRQLVFDVRKALSPFPVKVPCGQCIGCRLERSRQWAVRMMHEASTHADNCFITLTYSPEFMPRSGSLAVSDWQKFAKRLRKHFAPKRFKFFHCGEYGEKLGRPHYHACLFGLDFPDKYQWTERNGYIVYRSDLLDKLWPFGQCEIGSLTFESAAYVARYVTKKITGPMADGHYSRFDLETGSIVQVTPEYCTQSNGIAAEWFKKFGDEVFAHDSVISNGFPSRPPRFYDNRYELTHPEQLSKIKASRVKKARQHVDDNTYERLNVRERVKKAQISMLKRNIESE